MMNTVFLRQTKAEDIELLKKIYYEAWVSMREGGIKSRDENYPSDKIINGWLNSNSMFSICDYKDRVLGSVAFSKEADDDSSFALVIEDIVLDRKHRGIGCSDTVFVYADRIARSLDCNKIRLYVDGDNYPIIQSLIRNSFDFVGLKTLENIQKNTYEKSL